MSEKLPTQNAETNNGDCASEATGPDAAEKVNVAEQHKSNADDGLEVAKHELEVRRTEFEHQLAIRADEREQKRFEWEQKQEARDSKVYSRMVGPLNVVIGAGIALMGTSVSAWLTRKSETEKLTVQKDQVEYSRRKDRDQFLQEHHDEFFDPQNARAIIRRMIGLFGENDTFLGIDDFDFHSAPPALIEEHDRLSRIVHGSRIAKIDDVFQAASAINSDPKKFKALIDHEVAANNGRDVAEALKTSGFAQDAPPAVKAVVAEAVQELAKAPVLTGKTLVSDPLKHMWDPNDPFAFVSIEQLDKPGFAENFLPASAAHGRGGGGRLKVDGWYLAVKIRDTALTESGLRKNPWVRIRKKGTKSEGVSVPILDRLPGNNNYPIEISQGLANEIGVKTNDEAEILRP